jgi:DNA ligase-1
MNVKNKGVQATSCKHLKEIRGDADEIVRCHESAGVVNPSHKKVKLASIPAKIALAHAWKQTMNPNGYVMSEKLDGMRAYWDGKHLYTRSGLLVISPAWFTAGLPSHLELDGELFMGRKMFEECMSVTRRTDGGGDWGAITYTIFDAPTVKGGIRARLEAASAALAISETVHHNLTKKPAKVHPYTICTGIEHLLEELTGIEQVGGEGMMLRHPTAPHRGGRSNDLLKVRCVCAKLFVCLCVRVGYIVF